MSESRLDIIDQLQSIERKKEAFSENLIAIRSSYFEAGNITFQIDTRDYRDTGATDEAIAFNPALMMQYLSEEIQQLEKQGDELIGKLQSDSMAK
jgi:hypothetical protein